METPVPPYTPDWEVLSLHSWVQLTGIEDSRTKVFVAMTVQPSISPRVRTSILTFFKEFEWWNQGKLNSPQVNRDGGLPKRWWVTLSCRERLWGNQRGTCREIVGETQSLTKKTHRERKNSWVSLFPRKGKWAESLRRILQSGVISRELESLIKGEYGGLP